MGRLILCDDCGRRHLDEPGACPAERSPLSRPRDTQPDRVTKSSVTKSSGSHGGHRPGAGRPRIHDSQADRQRAYRDRQREGQQ